MPARSYAELYRVMTTSVNKQGTTKYMCKYADRNNDILAGWENAVAPTSPLCVHVL